MQHQAIEAQNSNSPSSSTVPHAYLRKGCKCNQSYVTQLLTKFDLDASSAIRLAQHAIIRSYEPNAKIWGRGQPVSKWCYVITGQVAPYVTVNGKNSLILVWSEGTWFGEQDILSGGISPVDIGVISETQLLEIPSNDFLECFSQNRMFAGALARSIAWKSQCISEMLSLIKHGNPAARVVLGIGYLAEMTAAHSVNPCVIENQQVVNIPLSQRNLAALFGVSRTTLSQCISALARSGWLTINYANIQLKNVQDWWSFIQKQRSSKLETMDEDVMSLLTHEPENPPVYLNRQGIAKGNFVDRSEPNARDSQ